jgi:hypothetical protein
MSRHLFGERVGGTDIIHMTEILLQRLQSLLERLDFAVVE